jgi:hypothetical protein
MIRISLRLGSVVAIATALFFSAPACVGGTGSLSGDDGGTGEADSSTPPSTRIDAGGASDAGQAMNPPVTSGLYYLACLTSLANGDPQKVFNFRATLTATATQLSVSATPLAIDVSGGPPQTVSTAGQVGSSATLMSAFASQFAFTTGAKTMTIPAEANPISGDTIVIDGAVLKGKLTSGQFCATLEGDVSQPIALTLDAQSNTCLFVPITEGDATPTFSAGDFTCSP